MMNPIYFKTQFKTNSNILIWPRPFCIITAYATTGETWTNKMNLTANESLKTWLLSNNVWHEPITGYDTETGHAEPGFAVNLEWHQGCDLGLTFKQDAIYYVDREDILFVTFCDQNRALIEVGLFKTHIT